jgi:hypothetical protein
MPEKLAALADPALMLVNQGPLVDQQGGRRRGGEAHEHRDEGGQSQLAEKTSKGTLSPVHTGWGVSHQN